MKINIEQADLAAILSKSVSMVEKKNSIPILSNLLLATCEGSLMVTGTDLDASVTVKCGADVLDHGSCTVNALLLSSVVGKLPKGKPIELSYENSQVRLTSGTASFDFSSLPPDDFPEISSSDFDSEFTCSGDEFKRLFDLSAFCQSTEFTRYYLNGVYLHTHDGMARAVATDGHRLARIDSTIAAEFPGIIVPRKIVGELRKLIDGGEVTVQISATKIRVTAGDVVLLSKVVDGTFPQYDRVIPTANNNVITADAGDMKAASDLVALMSSERTKAVRMSFAGGECRLEVAGSDSNKGCEVVAVQQDGDDLVIGFNARYLADGLSHIASDNVVMLLGGSGDPAVIQPEGDDSVLYVVMPIRVI